MTLLALLVLSSVVQAQDLSETRLSGVYQGKVLFVQNFYNPQTKRFCVEEISINGKKANVPINHSAVKIDFAGYDLFAPVVVVLRHRSECEALFVNPDAIHFHSIFSFEGPSFDDSVMVWRTRGEQADAHYAVEKYDNGIWREESFLPSKGNFGESDYSYSPSLEEGPNKYRVKYQKADGGYLYSFDLDFHFYPEPVTFTPQVTDRELHLSRVANYSIYDAGGKMVLSGEGNSIDVSILPHGDYVIYFNEKDPASFSRK